MSRSIDQFMKDYLTSARIYEINEREFEVFGKRFETAFSNSRENIQAKLEARQEKIERNKEQCKIYRKQMLDLEETKRKRDIELESSKKEIANAKEKKEKLLESLEITKQENTQLSVKLLEIQRAIDEKVNNMRIEWSCLVRAYNFYKKHLNIHLKLEKHSDFDTVQVTFFYNENLDKDNFYIILIDKNEKWTIDKIVPELSEEDHQKLSAYPREMKDAHAIALLTQLRKIFMNYKP